MWQAMSLPTPTVVVCDASSFSSARTNQDIEDILTAFPLKDETSSIKVSDNTQSLWPYTCPVFAGGFPLMLCGLGQGAGERSGGF